MKAFGTWALALAIGLMTSTLATAAVKVQLSDVHICCGACVKGIQNAVKDAGEAKVDIDRDGGSVTIETENDATAQKVVDAIAAAGYHGSSDHATIKVKEDAGAPSGKVTRLKLGGIHNCCGGCTNAIRDAVKGVSGVQADTLTNRATEFVVEGDFEAAEVIKALYAAGFHAKVAK